MEVKTFAELREVERYQMKIAEKHYLAEEYATARDEYEKFSPSTKRAQVRHTRTHVEPLPGKVRNVNTALRDGFQSVIEYWPDSREALLAAFLIARSYRDIGEVQKAEVAYEKFITTHPKGPHDHAGARGTAGDGEEGQQEEKRMKLLQLIAFSSGFRGQQGACGSGET